MLNTIIMNKTIYYHNKRILIGQSFSLDDLKNAHLTNAEEKPFDLKKHIDFFTASTEGNDLILLCTEPKIIILKLQKIFNYIEAAGGLIKNKEHYLIIKRLGKWDLPKGKMEKGESPETSAIRECEEECGIQELRIKNKLESTYHIYPYKNGYALKKTHWFLMNTNFNGNLKPQTEEDIEEVIWLTKSEIDSVVLNNTYPAIKLILNQLNKD